MTNNPRVLLWLALGLMLWLNFAAWNHDYAEQTPPTVNQPANASSHANGPSASTSGDLANQVPQAEKGPASPPSSQAASNPGSPATESTSGSAASSIPAEAAPSGAGVVHVRTDVLDLDISTRGGTIERVDLPKYPLVKGEATPVRLENHEDPQTLYLLQSGLTGPEPAPTHLATFTSPRSDYRLGTAQQLRVPLSWSNDHGVTVTKTYVFERGVYRIGVEYNIDNHSDAPWTAAPYAQILRNDPRTKRSMFNVESYAFHGPALWDGTKYRKLDTGDKDDSHLAIDVTNGWIAALQHHFVSAIVPPGGVSYKFTLAASGDQFRLAAAGPDHTVAPGASANFGAALFIGPKLQSQLKATSPELARAADYGHLYILAQPLFWLLQKVHAISGNWGVAIIFVTFLLKLAFYPLSEASGRSMAKMKQLAPRIKNLQETYKDDAEKRGRAMMELYQREKVNPVAGCLPIIIQIPVFLAFYWVLLESVEMRQAPFAFWIHDLSSRDPLFILPIIMAAAMFVQYKLNPAPPDPVQAKVFMFMPLVMSFMFAFFPAGLVLYWVTNTILSIAQQWNINRRIAAAATKKN
ncbi:MAG TPA: membrane protein insertase YidC [Steroidobacteraceae bacterium]|nr:membrane protein insertase YidC [Steroidobacteraceae bacterium]